MMRISFPIFLFLLLIQPLSAQQVRAYLNANKLTTDDVLQYSLELKDAKGKIFSPQFPVIEGFRAGGIQQQSRMVNWASSFIFTKTYYPQQAGTFKIPSFVYQYEGKNYKTPEFTVQVTKGTGKKQQQQQGWNPFGGSSGVFNDPFFNRKQPEDLKFEEVNADYFLSMNLNKKSCYIGEQILGEVVLYINERDHGKINIDAMAIGEMQQRIKNNAFWEEIIEFQQIPMTRVTLKGKRYLAYTLYRTVLFPIRSGKIEFKDIYLDSKKLFVATNASPFQSFFSNTSKYKPIKIRAGYKAIDVKPLPATNLPNATSVGSFRMSAKLSQDSLQTGETVEVNITVEGNGNITLMPQPKVVFPESFATYEPTSSFTIHKSENSLYGKKEFQFIGVPKKNGRINMAAVKFYYFNPVKEVYDSLVSGPLLLRIGGDNLEDLVLRSSSLDGFYASALDKASEKPASKSGAGFWVFLGSCLLLGGAFTYRKIKTKIGDKVA